MSGGSRKDVASGNKSRYQPMNSSTGNYKGQIEHRHAPRGMQSLGKISNYRCMPAPVQLQSIKSSSIDTSDGNVSLVPHGTSGWNSSNKDVKDDSKVTKTEKKEDGWKKTNVVAKTPKNFCADFPTLGEQEEQRSSRKDESKKKPLSEEKDHHLLSTESTHSVSLSSNAVNHDYPLSNYHSSHKQSGSGHYLSSYPAQRGSKYPPRQHGFYPPTQAPPHVNYSSPDPYDIAPYHPSIKHHERSHKEDTEFSVKANELEREDDDEGWAGHHEDIDYTKEVIFEDSSDEDNEQQKDIKKITASSSQSNRPSVDNQSKALPSQRGIENHYYQHRPSGNNHNRSRHNRDEGLPNRGQRSNFVPEWDAKGYHHNERSLKVLKKNHSTKDSNTKSTVASSSVPESYDVVDEYHPPLDSTPISRSTVPKKIMMRDFVSDKDPDGSMSSQHKGGATDHTPQVKTAWGVPPSHIVAKETVVKESNDQAALKDETMVYDITERGPIASDKTLYEPEGRTSEEKFRKYHRMSSGDGVTQRGRVSSSGSSSCKANDKPVLSTRVAGTTTPQDDVVFVDEEVTSHPKNTNSRSNNKKSKKGENVVGRDQNSLRERDNRKRPHHHQEQFEDRKEPQRRHEQVDNRQQQKYSKYEYVEDVDQRYGPYQRGRNNRRGGRGRGRGSRVEYYRREDDWEYYDEDYSYYYEDDVYTNTKHKYYQSSSESKPEQRHRSESKPVQRHRSESKPEQKPQSESIPEHKHRSESRPEQKPRSESRPEQKQRSENRPEQRHKYENRPEHRHRSESRPEQRHRSESRPEQKHRFENRPEQRHRSENRPEQKPQSESILEQKPRSEPIPEQKPRSEPIPDQKPRSEPIPEQKPQSEPIPDQKPWSEPIPDQKPRSEPIPEQKPRSESIPEQKLQSESMPEQKPRSESRPEQKPRFESRPEQKPRFESRPEQKPRFESRPEQKPRFESRPEQKPRFESRPDQTKSKQEYRNQSVDQTSTGRERNYRHNNKVTDTTNSLESAVTSEEQFGNRYNYKEHDWNEPDDNQFYDNAERRNTTKQSKRTRPTTKSSDDRYYRSNETEWGDRKNDGRRRGGMAGRGRGVMERDSFTTDMTSFPSRNFKRGRGMSRRGLGRGRGTRREDTRNERFETAVNEGDSVTYHGLVDIDSPSDWEEEYQTQKDITTKTANKNPTSSSNVQDTTSQYTSNVQSNVLFQQLPSNATFSSATPTGARLSRFMGVSQEGGSLKKSDGLLPTPKFFGDIDLNSHNVFVVDGQETEVGGAVLSVTSPTPDMEGFTVVESKKDKKDRDKKRKQHNLGGGEDHHKKMEDDTNRHRVSGGTQSTKKPTDNVTATPRSSGWNNFRTKPATVSSTVWSGGNRYDNESSSNEENWGKYGAIGERPSRENNTERNSAKVTRENSLVNDYRLFDNTSTNSHTPFPLNTKSGQLLSDAIDLTLSVPFSAQQVKNESSSSIGPSLSHSVTTSSVGLEKSHSSTTPAAALLEVGAGQGRSGQPKREHEQRSNAPSKKNRNYDQRYYVPPAARQIESNRASTGSNYSSANQPITKPNTKKPPKVMSSLSPAADEKRKPQDIEDLLNMDPTGVVVGVRRVEATETVVESVEGQMVDGGGNHIETLQQHQKSCSRNTETVSHDGKALHNNTVLDVISVEGDHLASTVYHSCSPLIISSISTTAVTKFGSISYANVLKNNSAITSSIQDTTTAVVRSELSPVSTESSLQYKESPHDQSYKLHPLSDECEQITPTALDLTTPTTCNIHCTTAVSTSSDHVINSSIATDVTQDNNKQQLLKTTTNLSITANEFIPNEGHPPTSLTSTVAMATSGKPVATTMTTMSTVVKPHVMGSTHQSSLLNQPPPHIVQMVHQLIVLSQSIQTANNKRVPNSPAANRFPSQTPPNLPLASLAPPTNAVLPLMLPYATPMTHPLHGGYTVPKQRADHYHRPVLPYMDSTDVQTNRLASNIHQIGLPPPPVATVTTVPSSSIYPSSLGPPHHMFFQPSNQPLPLATVPIQQMNSSHRVPPPFSQATPTQLIHHPHSLAAVDPSVRPALLPTPPNFNMGPPSVGATPTRHVTTPTTIYAPPPSVWSMKNMSPVAIPVESHMVPSDVPLPHQMV